MSSGTWSARRVSNLLLQSLQATRWLRASPTRREDSVPPRSSHAQPHGTVVARTGHAPVAGSRQERHDHESFCMTRQVLVPRSRLPRRQLTGARLPATTSYGRSGCNAYQETWRGQTHPPGHPLHSAESRRAHVPPHDQSVRAADGPARRGGPHDWRLVNPLLRQLTADACGRLPRFGPGEATSIGSLAAQGRCDRSICRTKSTRRRYWQRMFRRGLLPPGPTMNPQADTSVQQLESMVPSPGSNA